MRHPEATQAGLDSVRRLADRRLTADEVRAGLAARLDPAGIDEACDLIRWFRRRYPTARERLAFARHMYAQWTGTAPIRT